jgi:hypothetical protein
MSAELLKLYKQFFSSNLGMQLQQMGSKLRPYVTEGSYSGESASPVDMMAPTEARERTSRFGPMGRIDANFERRWIFPTSYDHPQLVDSFDKLRAVMDPQSQYVKAATMALGRKIDSEIIKGLVGTNKIGKNGADDEVFGTAVTTSAGRNVSVAVGASTSNLNTDKLIEARNTLLGDEVDEDTDTLVLVGTQRAFSALLAEVKGGSSGPNFMFSSEFQGGAPVIKNGRIESYMGFTFVRVNESLLPNGTDDAGGTSRGIIAYAKSGAHFGLWEDLKTDIAPRYDLEGIPYQVYGSATVGACRTELKKVVRIWCRGG